MKKLYSSLILFFKGFIMGVANIIPGVSGGTLAVILDIYEKLINSITTLFKKFKENILFLISVGLGMVIAIFISSGAIEYCLGHYPLATSMFFVGLILGGIPLLYKKIKCKIKSPVNILIFLLVFIALLSYTFLAGKGNDVNLFNLNFIGYLKLFLVGVIASATMIIPGISGSMTLMTLGYYNGIINTINNLTDFSLLGQNLKILIPFGIGVVVGIFAIAKVIEILLNKFEVKTYFGIFGFIFASLIIIFYQNVVEFKTLEFIVGLLLLVAGFLLSYFIANFKKKEKNIE